jgi:hypothetical protein
MKAGRVLERSASITVRADSVARITAAAALLVLGACARAPVPAWPPGPSPGGREEAAVRLFLIGDAGGSANNPVLRALQRELEGDGARSLVLFLGDNVYPNGLPDSSSRGFQRAERRLRGQIEAVRAVGARGVFLPGNHDWGGRGATAGQALRRQAAYIRRLGAPDVVLLPEPACPGPSVVEVDPVVRLIVLDTEWWLRAPEERGRPGEVRCEASEHEVLAALRSAIASSGQRRVIVAGHHPLISGGLHGSYFGWREQLFPLRDAWQPLWIPLPVLGSIYQAGRRYGAGAQDLASPPYRRMRLALEGVFAEYPPLAYVAGHEHNLQVLRADSVGYRLVSGAGTYDHSSRVSFESTTEFARAGSGYMRLDIWRDGRTTLAVVLVDGTGSPSESFSMILDVGTSTSPGL